MMRTRQGHKTKHHIKRTKLDISSSKKIKQKLNKLPGEISFFEKLLSRPKCPERSKARGKRSR